MDGTGRLTMTVTIDPVLHRFVSNGNNRSETVENIIRDAWRLSLPSKRANGRHHKDLMDPSYSYEPGRQSILNAIEMSKSLLLDLQKYGLLSTSIKYPRLRMLRYELVKFIQEGGQIDE